MTEPVPRNASYGLDPEVAREARSGLHRAQGPERSAQSVAPGINETAGTRSRGLHDEGLLLTPDEAAERLKVSTEQIRTFIRRGALAAVNLGTGRSRPLYRIPLKALEEFLAGRTHTVPMANPPQIKRRPPVPDHFADLP